MKISLASGTRLHFGLLGVSDKLLIKDGGIGLLVESPDIKVSIEPAAEFSIAGTARLNAVARQVLRQLTHSYKIPPLAISIDADDYLHRGFGFSTQIKLSVAYGVLFASGYKRSEIADLELAKILRVGGTSVVGFGAFFHGGLILDLGHRLKRSVGPSLNYKIAKDDVVIEAAPFPSWTVVLALAANLEEFTMRQERELFASSAPVPEREVGVATYHAVMGIWRASRIARFDDFCSAITGLRKIGFKKREIHVRGRRIERIFELLHRAGLNGISMSSWGPLAFGFCKNENHLDKEVLEEARMRGELVRYFITRADNRPFNDRVEIFR